MLTTSFFCATMLRKEMMNVVKQVGGVTIKMEKKGVDITSAGKRNSYQITLLNKENQKTTFTFYDSVVNFSKPLYHQDLLEMVLKTIYNVFYEISHGVHHKMFYTNKTFHKGLHRVLTKNWVDNIKLLQVLSE